MRTKGAVLALIILVSVISLVSLFHTLLAHPITTGCGPDGNSPCDTSISTSTSTIQTSTTTIFCNNVCGASCTPGGTGSCASQDALAQPGTCHLCESFVTSFQNGGSPFSVMHSSYGIVSPVGDVVSFNNQYAPWLLTCPMSPSQAASPADSRLFYAYPFETTPLFKNVAGDACSAAASQLQTTIDMPVSISWDTGTFANAIVGAPSPPKVTLVQSACKSTTSGTDTLAFPSPVTSGDMLVVAAGAGATGGPSFGSFSPSDSPQGNTWSNVETETSGSSSESGIWYAVTQNTGADSVTVNFNGRIRNGFCIYELSGAQAPTGSKAGSSSSSASVSPALGYGAGSFILGAVGSYVSATSVTGTSGLTTDLSSADYYLMEHSIPSSKGSSGFTVTWNAGGEWAESAAAFGPAPLSAAAAAAASFNIQNLGNMQVNALAFSPMLSQPLLGGGYLNTISSSALKSSYAYDPVPSSAVNVIWTWSAEFADFSGSQPDAQTANAIPSFWETHGSYVCSYDYDYSETTTMSTPSTSGLSTPFNAVNVMGTGSSTKITYNNFQTPVMPFITFNFFLTSPNGQMPLYSSYDVFSPWNYNTPQASIEQLPVDMPGGMLFNYNAVAGSQTPAGAQYGMLEMAPSSAITQPQLLGNVMSGANSLVNWLAQSSTGKSGGVTNWGSETSEMANFGLQNPNVPGPISIAGTSNNHLYVLNYTQTCTTTSGGGMIGPSTSCSGKYYLNVLELVPRGYHNLTGEPYLSNGAQFSGSAAWNSAWSSYWGNVIDMQNNTVYVSNSIDLAPYMSQFIRYIGDSFNCTSDTGCTSTGIHPTKNPITGVLTYSAGFMPLNISVDQGGDVYITGNVTYRGKLHSTAYGPGIIEIPGLGSGVAPDPKTIIATSGNWTVTQPDALSEIAVSPDGSWIYGASPSLGYIYEFSHNLRQTSNKIDLTYTPQVTKGVAQSAQSTQTSSLSSLDILWWLSHGGLYGVKFDGTGANGVAVLSPSNNPDPSGDFDLQGYHHPLGIANVNGYLYVLDDWQALYIGSTRTCSGWWCSFGSLGDYKTNGGTSFEILTLRVLDPTGANIPISPSLFNDILTQGSCTTTFDQSKMSAGSRVANPTTGTCFTDSSNQPIITCSTDCISSAKACQSGNAFSPVEGSQYECVGASTSTSLSIGSSSTYYSLFSTGQTSASPAYPPYGWILSANVTSANVKTGFCSAPSGAACQYTPSSLQQYSFKPIAELLKPDDHLPHIGFSVSYSGQVTMLFKKPFYQTVQGFSLPSVQENWPQNGMLIVANFSVENYTKYFDGSPDWSCYTNASAAAGLGCATLQSGTTDWLANMQPPVYAATSPFRYMESQGSATYMTLGGAGTGAVGSSGYASSASGEVTVGGTGTGKPQLTLSNKEIAWSAQDQINAVALASSDTVTISIDGTKFASGTGSVSAGIDPNCPSSGILNCVPPGSHNVVVTETGTDAGSSSTQLTIDQTPMIALSATVISPSQSIAINAFPAKASDSIQISASPSLPLTQSVGNGGEAYMCNGIATGNPMVDVLKPFHSTPPLPTDYCGPGSGYKPGSVSYFASPGTAGTYTVTAKENGKTSSSVFYVFSNSQPAAFSGTGVTLTGTVGGYAVIPYSYSYTMQQTYSNPRVDRAVSGSTSFTWALSTGLSAVSGCSASGGFLLQSAFCRAKGSLIASIPVALVQSVCDSNSAAGANILAYSSSVTSGDLLVVAEGSGDNAGSALAAPTDSEGNSWSQVAAATDSGALSASGIWYATAQSTGADTVTVNFNSHDRNGLCLYELSGAGTPTGAVSSSTGSNTASVSSIGYAANAFILGAVGSYQSGSVSGTSGFTVDQSSSNYFIIEHNLLSSAGSSTFPVTWTSSSNQYYAESAAVFNPAIPASTSATMTATVVDAASTPQTGTAQVKIDSIPAPTATSPSPLTLIFNTPPSSTSNPPTVGLAPVSATIRYYTTGSGVFKSVSGMGVLSLWLTRNCGSDTCTFTWTVPSGLNKNMGCGQYDTYCEVSGSTAGTYQVQAYATDTATGLVSGIADTAVTVEEANGCVCVMGSCPDRTSRPECYDTVSPESASMMRGQELAFGPLASSPLGYSIVTPWQDTGLTEDAGCGTSPSCDVELSSGSSSGTIGESLSGGAAASNSVVSLASGPYLSLSMTPSSLAIFTGMTPTMSATVSGGTGKYYYVWTLPSYLLVRDGCGKGLHSGGSENGITDTCQVQTAGTGAGRIYVQVTDTGNGATASTSMPVSVQAFDPSKEASSTILLGQSITLNAPDVSGFGTGVTYQWNLASGLSGSCGNSPTCVVTGATASASPHQVTLEVFPNSGSPDYSYALITVKLPPLLLSPVAVSIDPNNAITFTASAIKGTAPFTYAWTTTGLNALGGCSGASTTCTVSGSSAGTYSVSLASTDSAGSQQFGTSKITIASTMGSAVGMVPSSIELYAGDQAAVNAIAVAGANCPAMSTPLPATSGSAGTLYSYALTNYAHDTIQATVEGGQTFLNDVANKGYYIANLTDSHLVLPPNIWYNVQNDRLFGNIWVNDTVCKQPPPVTTIPPASATPLALTLTPSSATLDVYYSSGMGITVEGKGALMLDAAVQGTTDSYTYTWTIGSGLQKKSSSLCGAYDEQCSVEPSVSSGFSTTVSGVYHVQVYVTDTTTGLKSNVVDIPVTVTGIKGCECVVITGTCPSQATHPECYQTVSPSSATLGAWQSMTFIELDTPASKPASPYAWKPGGAFSEPNGCPGTDNWCETEFTTGYVSGTTGTEAIGTGTGSVVTMTQGTGIAAAISPSSLSIPQSEKVRLVGAASGGTPAYTYTWTLPAGVKDDGGCDSGVAQTMMSGTISCTVEGTAIGSYRVALDVKDSTGAEVSTSIPVLIQPVQLNQDCALNSQVVLNATVPYTYNENLFNQQVNGGYETFSVQPRTASAQTQTTTTTTISPSDYCGCNVCQTIKDTCTLCPSSCPTPVGIAVGIGNAPDCSYGYTWECVSTGGSTTVTTTTVYYPIPAGNSPGLVDAIEGALTVKSLPLPIQNLELVAGPPKISIPNQYLAWGGSETITATASGSGDAVNVLIDGAPAATGTGAASAAVAAVNAIGCASQPSGTNCEYAGTYSIEAVDMVTGEKAYANLNIMPPPLNFGYAPKQSPVEVPLFDVYKEMLLDSPLLLNLNASSYCTSTGTCGSYRGYHQLIYVMTDRFGNKVYAPIEADIAEPVTVQGFTVNAVTDATNSNSTTLGISGQAVIISSTGSATPLAYNDIYIYYDKDINYADLAITGGSKADCTAMGLPPPAPATSKQYSIDCAFGIPNSANPSMCVQSNPVYTTIQDFRCPDSEQVTYAPQFNSIGQCNPPAMGLLMPQYFQCNVYGPSAYDGSTNYHGSWLMSSCPDTGMLQVCGSAAKSGTCGGFASIDDCLTSGNAQSNLTDSQSYCYNLCQGAYATFLGCISGASTITGSKSQYCVPTDATGGNGICTSQLGLIAVEKTDKNGYFNDNSVTACGSGQALIKADFYGYPAPEPIEANQIPLSFTANMVNGQCRSSYVPITILGITFNIDTSACGSAATALGPQQELNYSYAPQEASMALQIGLVQLSLGTLDALGVAAGAALALLLVFRERIAAIFDNGRAERERFNRKRTKT